MDLHAASPESIDAAARHLLAGGLVVFPTETFYGLACDPRRADAVSGLFALKGRDPGRALPLIAGSREQVGLVAPGWENEPLAVRLATVFWPGPLSLVLAGSAGLADFVRAPDGTVAVRWSPHPVALALALAAGFPVVATSANRSGVKACRYAEEAVAALGKKAEVYVLDGGPTQGGLPSTLVDVRATPVKIVRAGAVEEKSIRTALAGDR